jgi:hypothetical protein
MTLEITLKLTEEDLEDKILQKMSQAASLTLFETSINPELVIAMFYANMMSKQNFDLSSSMMFGKPTPPSFSTKMTRINQHFNNRIYHLWFKDVIDHWGWVDYDEEQKRLDQSEFQNILVPLLENLEKRLLPNNNSVWEREAGFTQGRFLRYRAAIIDLILAHEKRRDDKRGETVCIDEATSIASLAALCGVPLDEIAIIGSPLHYTVFIGAGDGYWFESKGKGYDQKKLNKEFRNTPDYFDKIGLDRIITPLGIFSFTKKISTMDKAHLLDLNAKLAAFFGNRSTQFNANALENIEYKQDPTSARLDIKGIRDYSLIELALKKFASPGSVYESALYAARSLDVQTPSAYLLAALKDYNVKQLAKDKVKNISYAVRLVNDIKGPVSIFQTQNRVALPDEVMLFNTANPTEKAIFLYCLLYHSGHSDKIQDMHIETYKNIAHLYSNGTHFKISTIAVIEHQSS